MAEKLKLLPLAALLIITPLLSTSLKYKYLYFIVNILIIDLGAEAGLLSFILQPQPPPPSLLVVADAVVDDDDKPIKGVAEKSATIFYIDDQSMEDNVEDHAEDDQLMEDHAEDDQLLEDNVEDHEADDQLMEDNVEDHELYHKAEMFIGNFYKQLKMQRQESWNKFPN